jgi:hypothetical protein
LLDHDAEHALGIFRVQYILGNPPHRPEAGVEARDPAVAVYHE